MSEDDTRLPRNAEALLRAEALPEPDWSAQAERTLSRLKDVRPGTTESKLLEAPFPDERSETAASVAPPVSVPAASGSSGSLAALARQVAKKDARAGAQDIARESLSAALAARATSDIVAERVRRGRAAASETTSPSVSAPALAPVAPAAVASAAPAAPAAPAQLAAPPQPPARAAAGSSRAQWLAFGGIGLAAAAALLVFLRPAPEAKNSEPAAPVAVAPAEPKQTAPSAPPAPVATQPPIVAEAVPASEPAAVALAPKDGADEPKAAAKSELAAAPLPVAKSEPSPSKSRATAGTEPQRVGGAASPTRPAPAEVVLEETASAPGGASTGGALRPAEGTTTGGLPARPGTGAVQAALGSVMGSAKACLAGATASAPAQVTFGSDGRVQSATVGGPLAGTPAAQCVEAALKRARVSPFTNPTFSLPTTVRP